MKGGKSPVEEFLEKAQSMWLRADHVQVGDRVLILDEPIIDEKTFDKPYLVCRVRLLRTGEEYALRLGVRNVRRIAEELGYEGWKGRMLEVISIEHYPGLGYKGILWRGVKVKEAKPAEGGLSEEAKAWLRVHRELIGANVPIPMDVWNSMPENVKRELAAKNLIYEKYGYPHVSEEAEKYLEG